MSEIGWGIRRALAALAAGTIFSTGAAASAQQAQFPPGAVVQPLPSNSGAGAELRRHLSDLADNPRSLVALVGAGRAALALGDAQAALTFFGRAEEAAPRDPRVKAGMASALVQMEQPQHALRMFAEAVAFGAPEVEIAKDRGLAYDMVGDPRRAQQDYALALRRGDDREVRQRLALSLAISGERAAALNLIDADLRRHDRGAWRTRAFILALTGDPAGATQTAQSTMPAGAVQAMAPFLARLPALNPAQKAMAVHFGHFPADGQPARMAQAPDTSAYPGALAMAGGGRPDARQAPLGTQTAAAAPSRYVPPEPVSTAPRRRPGAVETSVTRGPRRPATLAAEPPPRQQAQAQARTRQPAQPQPQPAQPEQQPVRFAEAQPQPAAQQAGQQQAGQQQPAPQQPPPQQPVQSAPPPQQQPVQQAFARQPVPQPQPQQFTAASAPQAPPAQQPQPQQPQQPRPQQSQPQQGAAVQPVALPPAQVPGPVQQPPAAAEPPASRPGFDQIAALVSSLPAAEAPAAAPSPPPAAAPPPRTPPAEPRQAQPRPAQAQTAPRQQAQRAPARPAHPSRHWVQVAGGANKATLPREFARLKASAPALLGSRTAWTTPLRATNRLLVGPFDSVREAQEFVNQLARADISAFSWTSPEGQEIERLPNP